MGGASSVTGCRSLVGENRAGYNEVKACRLPLMAPSGDPPRQVPTIPQPQKLNLKSRQPFPGSPSRGSPPVRISLLIALLCFRYHAAPPSTQTDPPWRPVCPLARPNQSHFIGFKNRRRNLELLSDTPTGVPGRFGQGEDSR